MSSTDQSSDQTDQARPEETSAIENNELSVTVPKVEGSSMESKVEGLLPTENKVEESLTAEIKVELPPAEIKVEESSSAEIKVEESSPAENKIEGSPPAEIKGEVSSPAEIKVEESLPAGNKVDESSPIENTSTVENVLKEVISAANSTEESPTAENKTEESSPTENKTEGLPQTEIKIGISSPSGNEIEITSPVESKIEVTKYTFRRQVWTLCDKNNLVSFPRPTRGRIPNFHGAAEAAAKLVELEEFNNASYVKVNIDKPQENVRILTLEKGKKLFVPSPRTQADVLMSVEPENTDKTVLKAAVSRRGMLQLGKPIGLETDIKIDMIVMGSVAVSREGHRIGKGEGFGDLEYAVLAEIGTVTENTVIVTTVHDSQVFDTLPHELFQNYDVPVDIIITPTEIIRVTDRLPKPKGVLWNLLSERKMNLMAVLPILREKQIANGKECHLKEEDTDEETERTKRRLHKIVRYMKHQKRRFQKSANTPEAEKTVEEVKIEPTENKIKENKKRPIRRFNRRFKKDAKEANESNDPNESDLSKKLTGKKKKFVPNLFTLRINNITSDVRVRDLKNALAERNVKPSEITWRGQRGFAFIHFAKPKKEPETPIVMDDIVASLQDMKIANEGKEVTLHVEPAKPITRIETMNITAV